VEEQPTCGIGLAEHSVLPAKLGQLMASVARILETHMTALDLSDQNARLEHDAYQQLAREHQAAAAQLEATAKAMAGYRDLPMGRHDETAMSSPAAVAAFEQYVVVERELLTLFEKEVEHDKQMLATMRG
jgi:hypothetical protein